MKSPSVEAIGLSFQIMYFTINHKCIKSGTHIIYSHSHCFSTGTRERTFGIFWQSNAVSPVLSPTRLKKELKSRHFSSDAEVIAASETWLDG